MKIEKVTFKNFWEAPPEDLLHDDGGLVPTHQGTECVAQRRRWEIDRLIEGGLEPGEAKIN